MKDADIGPVLAEIVEEAAGVILPFWETEMEVIQKADRARSDRLSVLQIRAFIAIVFSTLLFFILINPLPNRRRFCMSMPVPLSWM